MARIHTAVGVCEGGVERGAVGQLFDGDRVVDGVGDGLGSRAEADAGDTEHAVDRDSVGADELMGKVDVRTAPARLTARRLASMR